MLALKLALVAASVLGASFASRRWGHAAGGLMAGLPMIIGPITAILLIDNPPERVRAIALATLQSQPAMLMHVWVFARAARSRPWPICLLLANGAYVVGAMALAALALPPMGAAAVSLVAWVVAGRLIAGAVGGSSGPVHVPPSELWWRLAVALAVAALVIEGAAGAPAAVGGVLLAAPIIGNVLPAFTLPRHGAAATARLLAGFEGVWRGNPDDIESAASALNDIYRRLPHGTIPITFGYEVVGKYSCDSISIVELAYLIGYALYHFRLLPTVLLIAELMKY